MACPNHKMYIEEEQKTCDKCLSGNYLNCVKNKCLHNSIMKSAIASAESYYYHFRNTYNLVDCYVCPSQFMADTISKAGIDKSRNVVMHNFCEKRTDLPEKDTKNKYVIYFGRLSREKGVHTLIEVCKELENIQFVFAGTGPLEEMCQGISNINAVGFKTGGELKSLIRNAVFSVSPSEWYENCSMSIIESLSLGTAVIGANIGGTPELIIPGETGLIFESGNKESLKSAILTLFNNPDTDKGMSEKCIEHSQNTIEKYTEKLLEIYSNLIKGNNLKMKKLNGTVIVTYRCNARCNMCNRYKKPSKPEEEITVDTIKKLPPMYFTNITGGEPFIREDLKDIVRELYKKSDRIVISTNGFFTDRIIDLCNEFPNVGIRISIEGLEETNNAIRGLDDGFNKGYTTLKKLVEMNHPDVGFGMTVQDANAKDLVPLYKLSDELNMEFATASLHNSFYFVEAKNIIKDRPMVAKEFEKLINELLKSNSPKKWFRAYFNHGLINYIYGQKRLLPCDMAFDTFFIDPYGDVMPCNGTKEKEVMGNLNETDWDALWNSARRTRSEKRYVTATGSAG